MIVYNIHYTYMYHMLTTFRVHLFGNDLITCTCNDVTSCMYCTCVLLSCAWYTQLCGYTPLSAKKIIYMHPELFVDRTCHTTTTNAVADATTSWHPRVWLSTRLLYIMWYTCTCTHVCMHTEKDGMIMITWVYMYVNVQV